MATKRPSFLKRQKELRRQERALEKREARLGRKAAKVMQRNGLTDPDLPVEGSEENHDIEP